MGLNWHRLRMDGKDCPDYSSVRRTLDLKGDSTESIADVQGANAIPSLLVAAMANEAVDSTAVATRELSLAA